MTTTHADHRNLTTTLSNGYKVDTVVLIGECPAFPHTARIRNRRAHYKG